MTESMTEPLLVAKKLLVNKLLEKNILLPPSLLLQLDAGSVETLSSRINNPSLPPVSSTSDLLCVLRPSLSTMDEEAAQVHGHTHTQPIVSIPVHIDDDGVRQRQRMVNGEFQVRVLSDYQEKPKRREVGDFVSYYRERFLALEKILRGRQELQHVLSISRVIQKKDQDAVAVIGMVVDKFTTKKNQAIILTIEDVSGIIRVLFSKNRPEVYMQAKDVCEDEVIGVIGKVGGSKEPVIFGNTLLVPDVPLTKELKKAPLDHPGMAAFITDIHIGSRQFMEENFCRMIKWIKGDAGNDAQRLLASKINYLFVGGDLVDGVGIYPGQEDDLAIKDIYDQYQRCAELMGEIPDHIKIIMIPGNHDAMRLNEPQPSLYKDICRPVWDLKNAMLVSNPSSINIHGTQTFPGFDVLLYHGYSFDYYVSHVESIRINGGYARADLIMKYLLQRRHLAPANTSTPIIPDSRKDPLVIETVPDFFLTGHIHRTKVADYRNVTLINGGCWQDVTAFQVKTGHNPEPCRVSLLDLQTRQVRLLRF